MTKHFFVDKYGVMYFKNFAEMKKEFSHVRAINQLSWERIHNLEAVGSLTKEESDFFKRINQRSTIFNVANLRRWGFFHIYPAYVEQTLKCTLQANPSLVSAKA